MTKVYLTSCLIFMLIFWAVWFSFSQEKNLKLEEADALYELPFPSEDQELKAIELYREVLQSTPDPSEAVDYVRASERLGNLLFTYGLPEEAKRAYQSGIRISKAFGVAESRIYAHHLFLGEVYFSFNRLDSSLFHLQQAESIQNRFTEEGEPERLYNALGVYFYETGNFNRAISYFSKAENYLEGNSGDFVPYARYSFSSNKASALAKLEKYDSAQQIYKNLLRLGINLDLVRINLANTYIEQRQPQEALELLSQINADFAGSSLSVLNLKGKSLLQLKQKDSLLSVLHYTDKLIAEDSSRRQNFQKGIHFTLWGDYWVEQKEWTKALESYQQSLIQLHPEFHELEISQNPKDFVLGVSVLSLFETLSKKAHASWQFYHQSNDSVYFELGMDTWNRAFEMARFISTNYDNDQARIFLGDQVLRSYQQAIEQLISFGEKEQIQEWIEQAFIWSEESKAEGLKIGTRLEAKKRKSGVPTDLILEEQNLLFSISRNYQKQLDGTESDELLDKERVDLQVALSRLREKMRPYSDSKQSDSEHFSLVQLQGQLPESTGVLSLFDTPSYLLVFYIDADKFIWKKVPSSQVPLRDLETWMAAILTPSFSRMVPDSEVLSFSDRLLGSLYSEIAALDELIVVPHGAFNSMPFELLPIDNGKQLLLEEVAVMYQFSTRFIQLVDLMDWSGHQISFAPFLESDTDDYQGFAALPGSKFETDQMKGEKFLGKDASRYAFLTKTKKAELIHLATHAVASTDDPNEAFIAFYPGESEFRVFAPELAFMDLNQVKLVYLSACETGAGQLSASEGLVSLARSFAFAGVEQMVISQWVSEDRVSAYLSGRFYSHLKAGESPSQSLRLAKLELLADRDMVQFHHPYYWANFKLIGQPSEATDQLKTFFGIVGLVFFGLGMAVVLWGWFRQWQ